MTKKAVLALASLIVLLPRVAKAEQYAIYCVTSHKTYVVKGQPKQIDVSEREDSFNVKVQNNEMRTSMTLLSIQPTQLYCNKHGVTTACVDSLYQSYHWTFKGDESFIQTFTETAAEPPFVIVREGTCKRI